MFAALSDVSVSREPFPALLGSVEQQNLKVNEKYETNAFANYAKSELKCFMIIYIKFTFKAGI